jgi:WD40 repeat protein
LSSHRAKRPQPSDRTVRVWDASDGECNHVLSRQAIAISPDGQWIASNDGHPSITNDAEHIDPVVRLTDAQSGQVKDCFDIGQYLVTAASFSGDGHRLFVATEATPMRIVWVPGRRKPVVDVRERNWLHVWDTTTGAEIFHKPVSGRISSLHPTEDGRIVAALPASGNMSVWNLDLGETIYNRMLGAVGPFPAALSPNEDLLATTSETGAAIDIHRIATRQIARSFKIRRASPQLLAWSPDDSRIAGSYSATTDRTTHLIIVWDAISGVEIESFTSNDGRITALTFSPNGRQLLAGTARGTSLIWDVKRSTAQAAERK